MMTFGKKTVFPRNYVLDNLMGPNCLQLVDEMAQKLNFHRPLRILDLGCGTGLTSMYVAREFSATVFAVDLWVAATDNYIRFAEMGLEDRIVPIFAEATALPFAQGYFDMVISIDAYHYFGANEEFLPKYLLPFVKKGGMLAVVIPGLQKPFEQNVVPEELKPFWMEEEMHFYDVPWWRTLWEKEPAIRLEEAFSLKRHALAWDEWLESENPYAVKDRDMMAAENGNYFDTIGLIATVV